MTAAGGLFTTTAMADLFAARARLPDDPLRGRTRALGGARWRHTGRTTSSIAEACRIKLYDADAIYAAAAIAGTPVIPLVRMLAERVHFLGGP